MLMPVTQAQQALTIAAYPAADEIIWFTVPVWKRLRSNLGIKVVSRQFGDHHTAMKTALSISVYLPDVIALEVGYVGRFAQGGGLEDLPKAQYSIGALRSRYVPYADQQAIEKSGAVVAALIDIGPGTSSGS